MQEVVFVNIYLKFDAELYHEGELPDELGIWQWMEVLERTKLAKFGSTYKPDKSAFVATFTDYSGKPKEPVACISAFAGTKVRAFQKLWVILEPMGFAEYGEGVARDNIAQIELNVNRFLKQQMTKK